MSTPKPTIVIVPGAFNSPSAYDAFATHLQEAGYPAIVTPLPSFNSSEPTTATCSADAAAIRQRMLPLIETEGRELIMLCHSYGGIPGGGAAAGLSTVTRAREGLGGGVLGLAYVAGFVVPENASLLQVLGGKHAPYVVTDNPSANLSTIAGARDVLYDDLDDAHAAPLIEALGTTSLSAFDSPAPSPAWAEEAFKGKLGFLACLIDQALPTFVQDMFVQKSGVEWVVKDVDAGHVPFVSRPEAVVRALGELVGLFRG